MFSFQQLQDKFADSFGQVHFPSLPVSLYEPARYMLSIKGKRIRPVLCLMGNDLFDNIGEDSFRVAAAIELFHNFTLIHDDILDKAPLRRGVPTVHTRFNLPSALLAGDSMLIHAYELINRIDKIYLSRILSIFNKTAIKVCEGQQLDMDFEQMEADNIPMSGYLEMIELKTSVLLAASLKMGAIMGGASERNANHLYEFGKYIGMAFQVQDDLLDAFGDPRKFGKQHGGDILTGKKTFLLLKALELCNPGQKHALLSLMKTDLPDRLEKVMQIYASCEIDKWASREKERFADIALANLDQVAVLSARKHYLLELASILLDRQA
ncbi:MAG TPA: polyprenyl synthetase family protein [Chitinophagaceae bacterium]|nr:polyprenyl synthetase family protein [Chitinophagaceae bacterium]